MATVLGHVFAKALEDAGVVHDLNTVTRIVIDIRDAMKPVDIHIQRLGDERLIDLAAVLAEDGG